MNDDDLQLIQMCQASFLLTDGSVYSQRGNMTGAEWHRECKTVADHLAIPIEQHWGLMQATEYTAKAIERPHRGLLGRSMIYWLRLNFHEGKRVATGTLMAAIYLHLSDPQVHQQPMVLYLEGYDAAHVAWAKMAKDETFSADEGANAEAWAKTARTLLESWRRPLASSMYKLGE